MKTPRKLRSHYSTHTCPGCGISIAFGDPIRIDEHLSYHAFPWRDCWITKQRLAALPVSDPAWCDGVTEAS